MAKVTIDIRAVRSRIDNASSKALFITSQQALKDCNYYCKQDQSGLINSSITHSDFENGKLIWKTPYAKRQYYLDAVNKDKNPNACKMWAHKAKAVHSKEWNKIMQAAFKNCL